VRPGDVLLRLRVQFLIDRLAARHGGGLLRLGKIEPHQVFVYLGKLGVKVIALDDAARCRLTARLKT
jgi:hypothetical protein